MSTETLVAQYRENPEFAQKVNERMDALLVRSATDPAFRTKLLTDWRAALAEFNGAEYTGATEIVFVENKADATIVLPDFVEMNAELSEQELETVAGGVTPTIAIISLVAATIEIVAVGIDIYKSM
jgi:lactobin A/cerein 7B family class IIb bacteriocin